MAGTNTLKVCMSDALEHMGGTGIQTPYDAAAQSVNNLLNAILDLDARFSVARLTIVDGPCRDKMIEAYLKYSKLREFANAELTLRGAPYSSSCVACRRCRINSTLSSVN